MREIAIWRSLRGAFVVAVLAGCVERHEFDEASYEPGEPQYGGTLNVGTVSVTLSALS